MKRILVLLLALVLCVCTLASCDFLNKIIGAGDNTNDETPATPAYDVDAAVTYVYNLYKNKSVTGADFEVTAVVAIKNVKYTVTWTVDTDKVSISKKDDNTYIVNVDEEAEEELAYVLTATITTPDGKTATKAFNLTVPKYVLWSHEEYMAAKENDNVVVKGIVVAINSKAAGNTRNHLFLADTKVVGGYYSYQMDKDPVADLGIEIGMTVEITGPVTPYSGMQEIKGGTARIVDTNKKTVEVLDITDKVLAGESLANYVGLPVTIKGVEIAGQELGGTSDYLKFKIGNATPYIRTYVTDFPTTLKAEDKATIDAAHAAHFGYNANVTGILVLYSGAPYLIPTDVNCFEYLQKIEKTPAEMVAEVLDQIKIGTSFSADEVVKLPTSVYSEVTLTWAVSETTNVTIADGNMAVVVPEVATEVTVTVTAVCGEATETKTFTVKLSRVATPVKEIIDMVSTMESNVYTESKYLVAGIITEVYNEQYGNMRIKDEFGNILTIYGTYSADGADRYDALENKPVAGDYVVVLGIAGQYKGTPQIKNGWIQSYTTPTSVADANTIGAAQENYTEEKYIVTGVITEVYNTQYGNMYITDGNGNTLTIYGTYSATGATRYDALSVQPVAGDTVTIYGSLGQYKGTAQIKNGWIVAHTAAATETPEETTPEENTPSTPEETTPSTPEETTPEATTPETPAENTLTIAEAIALGLSKDDNVFEGEKYYVTGVIAEVYNTQYGNMRLKDEAGNILTIYGSYSADGSTRYDSMTVKPVAGDTVTVYGYVGRYGTTPQIKNGWIVNHVAVAPSEPEETTPEETTPAPSTPETPAEPAPAEGTVIGVIADIAAANGWVDGNNSGRYDSFNLNEYISVSVTATATGSYGVNSGKPYGSPIDNWRIYQNESPSIVIAAAEGKTIVSVKVTYDVSKTGILTLNGANVESAALVEVNANSVTFSVGNTGTATNGQVRITAIEVVYA